jgi:hypothetical protein
LLVGARPFGRRDVTRRRREAGELLIAHLVPAEPEAVHGHHRRSRGSGGDEVPAHRELATAHPDHIGRSCVGAGRAHRARDEAY